MAAAAQPEQLHIDVDHATSLLARRGLTVRGRSFAVVTHPTYRQAAYIEKWRQAAKIDAMLARFDPAKDTEVSAFVANLIVESFESDAIFHVLAGGLVEVKHGRPQKWTREGADALAEWIAELDDPADQHALQGAILGVIASFFLSRIVAAAASQTSSADEVQADTPPDVEPTPGADDPSPSPRSRPTTRTVPIEDMPDVFDRILASVPPEQSTQPTQQPNASESANGSASSAS
jgi:hypothetical protein